MRLGEWRTTAPTKESMSDSVVAVLQPVLVDLGADADAECWVAWGDDPESRYSILAPTVAGLITMAVRITGPDGPRATSKLIRWSKVNVSELGVEASGGHRIVAVQVESLVLKGVDEEADRICEFVRGLLAGIDGRNTAPIPIAFVQAAAMGAVVAMPAPDSAAGAAGGAELAAAAEPAEPAEPEELVEAPTKPAPTPPALKPVAVPSPRVIPTAGKAASKQASKLVSKPAALVLVPSPAPVIEAPNVPEAPVPQPLPTPIAARAAAAQRSEQPEAVPAPPATEPEPVPDPDRSEWIGPHPIEEPATETVKPRPWKP